MNKYRVGWFWRGGGVFQDRGGWTWIPGWGWGWRMATTW